MTKSSKLVLPNKNTRLELAIYLHLPGANYTPKNFPSAGARRERCLFFLLAKYVLRENAPKYVASTHT
jgi:hypothetical protein